MQQIPQQMIGQLEQQLKRLNPQAFKEYQEQKQNNVNPNEYLNRIVNGFNPEKRQSWNNMFNGINLKS